MSVKPVDELNAMVQAMTARYIEKSSKQLEKMTDQQKAKFLDIQRKHYQKFNKKKNWWEK